MKTEREALDTFDDDRLNQIVANAARLFRDGRLLNDANRHASAFALAVLALEEVGKVILKTWRVPHKRDRATHLEKQAAVACLLATRPAIAAVTKHTEGALSEDELVERVAKELRSSNDGRFLANVRLGALERAKQVALYHDDWLDEHGLHADQFEATDVVALFETVRSAIDALAEERMMKVGRAMFLLSRAHEIP